MMALGEGTLDRYLERGLFSSRWLLAPFYLGLSLATLLPLYVFLMELAHLFQAIPDIDDRDVVMGVLSLVDLSLTANLLVMVVFAGYENFISRFSMADEGARLAWMGRIDFSGLKLRLIASIVAISGVHLLRAFMSAEATSDRDLMWLTIIHLTFVVSGVLLALMDWLTAKAHLAQSEH